MGERCLDSRLLRDYGICHEFIKQVCSYIYPPPHKCIHPHLLYLICKSQAPYICPCCNLQVTGFVINPEKPGQKFVEGRLVPYEQQ